MCAKIDIKAGLMKALVKLYHDDHSLIRRKCCERSIVFRLGHYLVNSIEEYNLDVDCEYNKRGDDPKSLTKSKYNYPDLIVHKRETNESNLLVVEVKTTCLETNLLMIGLITVLITFKPRLKRPA